MYSRHEMQSDHCYDILSKVCIQAQAQAQAQAQQASQPPHTHTICTHTKNNHTHARTQTHHTNDVSVCTPHSRLILSVTAGL